MFQYKVGEILIEHRILCNLGWKEMTVAILTQQRFPQLSNHNRCEFGKVDAAAAVPGSYQQKLN